MRFVMERRGRKKKRFLLFRSAIQRNWNSGLVAVIKNEVNMWPITLPVPQKPPAPPVALHVPRLLVCFSCM